MRVAERDGRRRAPRDDTRRSQARADRPTRSPARLRREVNDQPRRAIATIALRPRSRGPRSTTSAARGAAAARVGVPPSSRAHSPRLDARPRDVRHRLDRWRSQSSWSVMLVRLLSELVRDSDARTGSLRGALHQIATRTPDARLDRDHRAVGELRDLGERAAVDHGERERDALLRLDPIERGVEAARRLAHLRVHGACRRSPATSSSTSARSIDAGLRRLIARYAMRVAIVWHQRASVLSPRNEGRPRKISRNASWRDPRGRDCRRGSGTACGAPRRAAAWNSSRCAARSPSAARRASSRSRSRAAATRVTQLQWVATPKRSQRFADHRSKSSAVETPAVKPMPGT